MDFKGVGSFFRSKASGIAHEANKIAGGAAGMAGYFTGLGPQVEEAVSQITGKAANHGFGHRFLNASATSAKPTGPLAIGNLLPHMLKEAPKGKGVGLGKLTNGHNYQLTGGAKAIVLGAATFGAVKGAADDSYQNSMGQVDTINQAPPSMTYDYNDVAGANNGADGGLVFSLNKLRNG